MDLLRPCAAQNYSACVREVYASGLGSTPANFGLIKPCSYIVAVGGDTAKCNFQQVGEKIDDRLVLPYIKHPSSIAFVGAPAAEEVREVYTLQ